MFQIKTDFPFPCYRIREASFGFVVLTERCLVIVDHSGEVKERYSLSNPSHICLSDDNTLAVVINTSGRLFFINFCLHKMEEISVPSPSEGNAPVYDGNSFVWTDWRGRLLSFSPEQRKVDIIADVSSLAVPVNCMVDRNRSTIYVMASLHDNWGHVLFSLRERYDTIQRLSIPLENTDSICSTMNDDGDLFVYDNHMHTIYQFGLAECGMSIKKETYINDGRYYDSVAIHNDNILLMNSERLKLIDLKNGENLFEFSAPYLSDAVLGNGSFCVGTWERGYLFSI